MSKWTSKSNSTCGFPKTYGWITVFIAELKNVFFNICAHVQYITGYNMIHNSTCQMMDVWHLRVMQFRIELSDGSKNDFHGNRQIKVSVLEKWVSEWWCNSSRNEIIPILIKIVRYQLRAICLKISCRDMICCMCL